MTSLLAFLRQAEFSTQQFVAIVQRRLGPRKIHTYLDIFASNRLYGKRLHLGRVGPGKLEWMN